MRLQLTLAIFKPDLCRVPVYTRDVRRHIDRLGFRVVVERSLCLNKQQARDFYGEHSGKFFHARLVQFISSGPLVAIVLARYDAIAVWRNAMGSAPVCRAVYEQNTSLRATFGLTDTRNALHGSDSVESAEREISFFFPEFSARQWIEENEKTWKDEKSV